MAGRMHISTLFIKTLILASIFMITNATPIEVDDEHPFTYANGTLKGPEKWGEIHPNWTICGEGQFQSPIDIVPRKVTELPSLGPLKKTYKPARATIKNRGHDIMVSWTEDAGGVIINGTKYKLVQCHWHTPSEHRIKGRSFSMELHMVHKDSQGQIAVIGVMYELGRPDSFLNNIIRHIKSTNEEETDLGVVDPWGIKFGSRKYFRYMGSLTVPPCTEGITWTIINKVRTVSKEQIKALRKAVHDGFEDNSRPIQEWAGRTIYLYRSEIRVHEK